MPTDLVFPPGFLWGAAAAAHQVEGGNTKNDWWRWEQAPGHVAAGDCSGLACDHFRRYRDDFSLLAELGHTAHRLSVEWSRIEPRPGEFDPEAIAHYRDVLQALREHGLEPFVTLHHFTNPLWLADAGGWLRAEAVAAFERFVARVAAEYRDLVRYWITINEPTVYAFHSYHLGVWPPGRRSAAAALRVLRHLARAHLAAYRALKAANPDALVGVAHHLAVIDPARPASPADRAVAALWRRLLWELYPTAFARGAPWPARQATPPAEDFFGLNYYTRARVRFDPRPGHLFGREVVLPAPRNTLGWELYPEGLERILLAQSARFRRQGRPGLPIVITENGVADVDDQLRPAFLVRHLAALHRALQRGAPVAGYLHWSSMDNFEWAHGFAPRFGLIAVDYATQERRPKPSAHLYAEIIRRNALSREMLERYA